MSIPFNCRRQARIELMTIRGNVRYRIYHWEASPASAGVSRPPLVLAHGWMDVGASFQFMVDHLSPERCVVAFDWRGFGASAPSMPVDSYWFNDYLGDLDAILDRLYAAEPVDLLGHSMGGNIVMSYAGLRPARVRKLVNLEGYGLPDTAPEDAPQRLVRWLDELKIEMGLTDFSSRDEVAQRLRKRAPRMEASHADWLAAQWAEPRQDGRWHVLGDPAHKRVNPVPYRSAEAVACWRRIAAPLLLVEGADADVDRFTGDQYPRAEFESRLACVRDVRRVLIEDSGHMIHLEQPQWLAPALESFLDEVPPVARR